jgi:hypothetical protein
MNETGTIEAQIERRRGEVARLDQEVRERVVRRAGLLAEIEELRKSQPVAPPEAEVTVGDRVVAFIQSRNGPVQTKEVIAHLSESDLDFSPNGVSVLLDRKSKPGRPLRKIGRGTYEFVAR